MLDWLRFRYQLSRLERKKRGLRRYFSNAHARAKKQGKASKDLEELSRSEYLETELIDDDIVQLLSTHLRSQADKYFLPTPKFDTRSEKWERSDISGRYRLSPDAIRELRATIRAEQKERSELARSWACRHYRPHRRSDRLAGDHSEAE